MNLSDSPEQKKKEEKLSGWSLRWKVLSIRNEECALGVWALYHSRFFNQENRCVNTAMQNESSSAKEEERVPNSK